MLIESVDEPEPTTEAGMKVGVAPEGNPVTLKDTLPAKPLREETLTV